VNLVLINPAYARVNLESHVYLVATMNYMFKGATIGIATNI
jgi:hypothetical protein